MTCFDPVLMYRAKPPAKGMTRTFAKSIGTGVTYPIPCGGCIGCRTSKAQMWSVRCMHENSLHDVGAFVTLTYDNDHLPADYSLDVRDIQLFNKRVRAAGHRFRFLAVGEYGDQTQRPHYHMLMFGFWPDDAKLWSTINGVPNYHSKSLADLWGLGHVAFGRITSASAAYCARYSLKKITGTRARDHYTRIHPLSGNRVHVRPEFITMSRRPGIGSGWFDKFGRDCFPSDYLVHDGKRVPVPAYYLRKLSEESQQPIKDARTEKMRDPKVKANSTPDRLAVRKEVLEERLKQLKRTIE